MKRWLFALLISLSTVVCSATELVSPAVQNNNQRGIMFDIRALNATDINAFSFQSPNSGTISNVSVYTKSGTHVGFGNTPGAWTLLGTVSVLATGARQLIPLKFNVPIAAGNTQAFFILSSSNVLYADAAPPVVGDVYGADANLEILSGTGMVGFSLGAFPGRVFVGSVIYGLQPPAAIAVVSGTPQSALISTAFGAPLVVQVTDAGNNPLPAEQVTFTLPVGASATLSSATCVTDLNGRCSVTATANGTGGTYNVQASVAGVVTPAVFALTNTLPASMAAGIPTLSEWATIALSILLAILAGWHMRRSRT